MEAKNGQTSIPNAMAYRPKLAISKLNGRVWVNAKAINMFDYNNYNSDCITIVNYMVPFAVMGLFDFNGPRMTLIHTHAFHIIFMVI